MNLLTLEVAIGPDSMMEFGRKSSSWIYKVEIFFLEMIDVSHVAPGND